MDPQQPLNLIQFMALDVPERRNWFTDRLAEAAEPWQDDSVTSEYARSIIAAMKALAEPALNAPNHEMVPGALIWKIWMRVYMNVSSSMILLKELADIRSQGDMP